MGYTEESIYEMGQIEHIRKNSGMYVGNTETATRLVEEVLDNSLDEVQAGYANIIAIVIDTKNKIYKILDNGRGFPFNQKLPEKKDPPILATTKLFTSGKFDKDKKDSAYQIASGLHGVGLAVVNALVKWIEIDIYKDKYHATYRFVDAKDVTRKQERIKKDDKVPYSTKISFCPSEEYFTDVSIDISTIEERLRIACVNYPNLKAVLNVDGKNQVIEGTERDLILSYLSKDIPENEWATFNEDRNPESCYLKIAWDLKGSNTQKILSCVNLVRVHTGVHINKLYTALRNVFSFFAKKYKYDFKPDDCLVGLRAYLNLKIIQTSFEAQVKVKLESKSDLTVMETLEKQIKEYFESNDEIRTRLLEKFQLYRESLSSKKLVKTSGRKRSFTKFTKLRDCSEPGGELFISEGDSAIGNLILVRNPKKHALLPLKGVIPNALTKKDLLKNEEIKDIIQAIGTDVGNNFNIHNLRYSKILLCADADPAGKFITTLLIILFASLTPDLIKSNRIFVCETPLFGTGYNKSFKPLWTKESLDIARKGTHKIRRFKGLGEFNSDELKYFTLNTTTRRLIPVKWTKDYEKIFELMTKSERKRELVLNQWSI